MATKNTISKDEAHRAQVYNERNRAQLLWNDNFDAEEHFWQRVKRGAHDLRQVRRAFSAGVRP